MSTFCGSCISEYSTKKNVLHVSLKSLQGIKLSLLSGHSFPSHSVQASAEHQCLRSKPLSNSEDRVAFQSWMKRLNKRVEDKGDFFYRNCAAAYKRKVHIF